MTTQQCLGRLTLDKGNIPLTKFSNAPKFGFFLPRRCNGNAVGSLCTTCSKKMETLAAEIPIKGINNIQNQSDRVHGLVTEPVPDWSRLYGGKKIGVLIGERAYDVDEKTMACVEEAFIESVKGIDCDIMKIIMDKSGGGGGSSDATSEKKAKKPTKKSVEPTTKPVPKQKKVPAKVEVPTPVAVPEPEPIIVAAEVKPTSPKLVQNPKPNKKTATKPKPPTQIPATFQPQFIVDPKPLDISELRVIRINVKKTTLDERELFLSTTGEIYDLKFKPIGRYDKQADTIEYEEPAEEQEEITGLKIFDVEV